MRCNRLLLPSRFLRIPKRTCLALALCLVISASFPARRRARRAVAGAGAHVRPWRLARRRRRPARRTDRSARVVRYERLGGNPEIKPRAPRRWAGFTRLVPLILLAYGYAGDSGYPYPPAISVGLGLDYYELCGFDYGGWAPGYRVGPPREGMRQPEVAPCRGYRPPTAGRALPPIPSMPNWNGARPDGGRRR